MNARTILSLLVCATAATAQAPTPEQTRDLLANLQVPIHDSPNDPHGPYGVWAAGPRYKASFHDGFAFYPLVGRELEHQPFVWNTDSVRVGETNFELGDASESFTDWRFERKWEGGVVEAYDVRSDGVEQTFRFDSRPAGDGALVIRGHVATPLRADAITARHTTLDFRLGDRAFVHYGAAVAIDATGARIEMATTFDGEHIELTLDAGAMRTVEFPLLVDPLIYPSAYVDAAIFSPSTILDLEANSSRNTLLVGIARLASASDADMFAFEVAPDLVTRTSVWGFDLSATNYVQQVAVAATEGLFPNRAVAWQRFTSIGPRIVFKYGSTTVQSVGGPVGQDQTDPDIAGSDDSNSSPLDAKIAITYAAMAAGGVVRASIVDEFGTLRSDTVVWTGAPGVADQPTPSIVHKNRYDHENWWIAWRSAPGSISLARLDSSGSVITHLDVITDPGNYLSQPKLDGSETELLVTYVRLGSGFSAPAFRSTRIHSSLVQPPVVGETRSHGLVLAPNQAHNAGVAFSRSTQHHWCASFGSIEPIGPGGSPTSYTVKRLGWSGAEIESVAVAGSLVTPARAPGDEYWLPYTQRGSIGGGLTDPVWCLRMEMGPASVSNYGTSCAPDPVFVWTDVSPPHAGAGTLRIHFGITGFTPANAWYLIGYAPASGLGLDVIGMTGCELLVDVKVVRPVMSTGSSSYFTTQLPDYPNVWTGDFYGQLFYLDPSANALGLVAHEAQHFQVR